MKKIYYLMKGKYGGGFPIAVYDTETQQIAIARKTADSEDAEDQVFLTYGLAEACVGEIKQAGIPTKGAEILRRDECFVLCFSGIGEEFLEENGFIDSGEVVVENVIEPQPVEPPLVSCTVSTAASTVSIQWEEDPRAEFASPEVSLSGCSTNSGGSPSSYGAMHSQLVSGGAEGSKHRVMTDDVVAARHRAYEALRQMGFNEQQINLFREIAEACLNLAQVEFAANGFMNTQLPLGQVESAAFEQVERARMMASDSLLEQRYSPERVDVFMMQSAACENPEQVDYLLKGFIEKHKVREEPNSGLRGMSLDELRAFNMAEQSSRARERSNGNGVNPASLAAALYATQQGRECNKSGDYVITMLDSAKQVAREDISNSEMDDVFKGIMINDVLGCSSAEAVADCLRQYEDAYGLDFGVGFGHSFTSLDMERVETRDRAETSAAREGYDRIPDGDNDMGVLHDPLLNPAPKFPGSGPG